MTEATRINPYSLADLKNTSDDAIPLYLNKLGYKQSHTLTDVRLGLGLSACAIAGATFAFDYKLGFEKTKDMTLVAVVAYFILNSLLTWWVWWVEGGRVYVGEKNGIKTTIATKTEKYDHRYYVTITETFPNDPKEHKIEVSATFISWFDEKGQFIRKPFETWLQSTIPSVAASSNLVELDKPLEDKSKKPRKK